VRTEVEHWANPILGAVRDLHRRLANILERGNPALSRDAKRPIAPGWSLTGEYYRVPQSSCSASTSVGFDCSRSGCASTCFVMSQRRVNFF
jgi:hypothetical protein